jgi:hypothetical protein
VRLLSESFSFFSKIRKAAAKRRWAGDALREQCTKEMQKATVA